MTTTATVQIGSKEYNIEGDDVGDVMSKLKYSLVTFRIIRCIGFMWTRKILWPAFSVLQRRDVSANVDISIPDTLSQIIETKTEGSIFASLDIVLERENFDANAEGRFNSDGLSFTFEGNIESLEDTGNAIKDAFKLIKSYDVDVDEIKFVIDKDSTPKVAKIEVDADVPKSLNGSAQMY